MNKKREKIHIKKPMMPKIYKEKNEESWGFGGEFLEFYEFEGVVRARKIGSIWEVIFSVNII